MKSIGLMLFFLLGTYFLSAQKRPLDWHAQDNWPDIFGEQISNDGKYVLYTIKRRKGQPTLVIQAADNSRKKEIPGGTNASITEDCRHVIFNLSKSKLAVLSLSSFSIDSFPNVSAFKLPAGGNGNWLAYKLDNPEKVVVLLNLVSGEEKRYPSIIDFSFSSNGNVFLMQAESKPDSASTYIITWMDLPGGHASLIWESRQRANNFLFDEAGGKLAFLSEGKIIYYEAGMGGAVVRITDKSIGIPENFTLSGESLLFGVDGKKLFFEIQHKRESQPVSDPSAPGVDVWNYKDEQLQANQMFHKSDTRKLWAVINRGEDKVVCLENDKDDHDFTRASIMKNRPGDYLLIKKRKDYGIFWKRSSNESLYLVSTRTGNRSLIKKEWIGDPTTDLSPTGKYAVWYDSEKKNFFTYNVFSGIVKNISGALPPFFWKMSDFDFAFSSSYGVAGWLENDASILIYDRYDIWKLDPDGIRAPVNLTNMYGRKHLIELRFVDKSITDFQGSIKMDKMLLAGFNESNKNSGFFECTVQHNSDPLQLTMSPDAIYFPYLIFTFVWQAQFLEKARNADAYLLKPMNAAKYPNLCITKDLKTIATLSDLHPEKEYNWLAAELIHWKTFDGTSAEGILYKPEDFDPRKKYPVIFCFYEKLADGLNQFMEPGLSTGPMNIPYFVSNGYLVFCPNIYYKAGRPGRSVYNSVASAAAHLSKLPWVDSTKLGLQGHSMGGYEVNDLVTRTGRFAAAVSVAGPSDMVSLYGTLRFSWGTSIEQDIEIGQNRVGGNLWEKKAAFLENSPVFRADKVSTPLLIMHNKNDVNVPWPQGVEYFMALRRLNKKVWMLQYDNERHTLQNQNNQLDYSKRMLQFFDHYLKNAPPPVWMTLGVPARIKGLDSGLAPDISGIKP